jgi:hypothetical protein
VTNTCALFFSISEMRVLRQLDGSCPISGLRVAREPNSSEFRDGASGSYEAVTQSVLCRARHKFDSDRHSRDPLPVYQL